MKLEDVKAKMDAAYDKWQKRVATTAKMRARADKNWEIIKKNGWDKYLQENGEFNPWDVRRETGSDKAFDITYKYNDAIDAEAESKKKEPEVEQIYKNWVKKYNDAIKFTSEVDEMPEIFKETIKMLADEWTAWDIAKREEIKRARKAVDAIPNEGETREAHRIAYKEFRKLFKCTIEQAYSKTDEEFYKKNEDTATAYMKDLVHRIKNKVSEITNMRNIHFSGKALNGFVEGTLGKAYIDTILAGGYNIQRLHYRVLVK